MSRQNIPYAGPGLVCDGVGCGQHSEVTSIKPCPECGYDFCEPCFDEHFCNVPEPMRIAGEIADRISP